MASSQIISLKIEAARHRSEALRREVKRLKDREFGSGGSVSLISFVEMATQALLSYLKNEEEFPDKELLTEEELEDRVHRVSKLIPFLHDLLAFIDGSEIGCAPVPLVSQLRRLAAHVVPKSEVIVTTRPELNYSIMEVASWIRGVFAAEPFEQSCAVLPSFLFVITLPQVEAGDVLLHCILSHELGHGLYQRYGLPAKILPRITINQDLIKKLASSIAS
ncbi:MAG: hypothetical protein ACRD4R_16540 [Candidatus Acidiferrales bacterium]